MLPLRNQSTAQNPKWQVIRDLTNNCPTQRILLTFALPTAQFLCLPAESWRSENLGSYDSNQRRFPWKSTLK